MIYLFLVDTSSSMAMRTGANGLSYLDLAKSAVERFIAFRKGFIRGHHRGDHYLLLSTGFDYTCVQSMWEDGMDNFMKKLKGLNPVDFTNLENGIYRSFELINQKRYRGNFDTLGFGRNTSKIVPSYVIVITDGSSLSSLDGGGNIMGQAGLRDRLRKRSIRKEDVFRWDQKVHTIVLHIPPQTFPRNSDKSSKIKVSSDREAAITLLGEFSHNTGGSIRVVGSLGDLMNHLNFLATGKFFGEFCATFKHVNPPKKHHRNQFTQPLKHFRTINNERANLNRITHQSWWPIPESVPVHANMKEFPPRDAHPKLYIKFPFRVGTTTNESSSQENLLGGKKVVTNIISDDGKILNESKKKKTMKSGSSILDDSFIEKMTSDRYEIDPNTKLSLFLKEYSGCECQVFVRNSGIENTLSSSRTPVFRHHHHHHHHHHNVHHHHHRHHRRYLHPHHPMSVPENQSSTSTSSSTTNTATTTTTTIMSDNNSQKYGDPIGFVKYDLNLQKCFLFILPYNYPFLIRVFRQFAANNYVLSGTLRNDFEKYFKTVPFYYIHPLKQTLQKISGKPIVINSLFKQTYHGTYTLPYLIDSLLKNTRNEEKEREDVFRRRVSEIRFYTSQEKLRRQRNKNNMIMMNNNNNINILPPPPPPPPQHPSSSTTKTKTIMRGRMNLGDFRSLFHGGRKEERKKSNHHQQKQQQQNLFSPTKSSSSKSTFAKKSSIIPPPSSSSSSSSSSKQQQQQQQLQLQRKRWNGLSILKDNPEMRRRMRMMMKEDIFSIGRSELFEQIHVMKSVVKKYEKEGENNTKKKKKKKMKKKSEKEEKSVDDDDDDFFFVFSRSNQRKRRTRMRRRRTSRRPFRKYSDLEKSNLFVDQHSISHEKMQNFTDHLRKKRFLRKPLIDDQPLKINFGNPYAPKKRKTATTARQQQRTANNKVFLKSDAFDLQEMGEKNKNRNKQVTSSSSDKEENVGRRFDDDDNNNNNVRQQQQQQPQQQEKESGERFFEKMKKKKLTELLRKKKQEKKKKKEEEEEVTDEEEEIDDVNYLSGKKRKREKSIEEEILEDLSLELSDISILEKNRKGIEKGSHPNNLNMFQNFVFSELAYSKFEEKNINVLGDLKKRIRNPGKIDHEQFIKDVSSLDGSKSCKEKITKNLLDLSNRFKRRKLSSVLESLDGK